MTRSKVLQMHNMGIVVDRLTKPGDERLPLTHPDDLSSAIAKELQAEGNGFEVKHVVSDIASGNRIAALLGQA